jgi:hypothetical protein
MMATTCGAFLLVLTCKISHLTDFPLKIGWRVGQWTYLADDINSKSLFGEKNIKTQLPIWWKVKTLGFG